MFPAVLIVPALLISTAALAAGPKTNVADHSNGLLIDAATAKAVLVETIPAKVWKVYPAAKWAFVSQVEGGVKAGTCVVAARVMMLPLSPTLKVMLFRPEKTATAYDAVPNSNTEACKAVAKDKLKEATEAVVSALVKT